MNSIVLFLVIYGITAFLACLVLPLIPVLRSPFVKRLSWSDKIVTYLAFASHLFTSREMFISCFLLSAVLTAGIILL